MTRLTTADAIWFILMMMTLGSAFIAESAEPGFFVTLTMCLVITLKGRMIIDHFMELHNANKTLRKMMRTYFYVIPILIMLVYLIPEQIADLTRL